LNLAPVLVPVDAVRTADLPAVPWPSGAAAIAACRQPVVADGSAPGTAADTTHMRSLSILAFLRASAMNGYAAITGRPARKANDNASLLTRINPGTGGPSSPLARYAHFMMNNSWALKLLLGNNDRYAGKSPDNPPKPSLSVRHLPCYSAADYAVTAARSSKGCRIRRALIRVFYRPGDSQCVTFSNVAGSAALLRERQRRPFRSPRWPSPSWPQAATPAPRRLPSPDHWLPRPRSTSCGPRVCPRHRWRDCRWPPPTRPRPQRRAISPRLRRRRGSWCIRSPAGSVG
jgi:hypothetical protein